jgi:hypothetical protein
MGSSAAWADPGQEWGWRAVAKGTVLRRRARDTNIPLLTRPRACMMGRCRRAPQEAAVRLRFPTLEGPSSLASTSRQNAWRHDRKGYRDA